MNVAAFRQCLLQPIPGNHLATSPKARYRRAMPAAAIASREDRRARRAAGSYDHNREIGPAIAEGSWATDNFDRCEEKWARLLAGARFENTEKAK